MERTQQREQPVNGAGAGVATAGQPATWEPPPEDSEPLLNAAFAETFGALERAQRVAGGGFHWLAPGKLDEDGTQRRAEYALDTLPTVTGMGVSLTGYLDQFCEELSDAEGSQLVWLIQRGRLRVAQPEDAPATTSARYRCLILKIVAAGAPPQPISEAEDPDLGRAIAAAMCTAVGVDFRALHRELFAERYLLTGS